MKGKVKFFEPKKGYGFITPESEEMTKDVFVHYSEIEPGKDGFKTLDKDQKVAFDVVNGERGFIAKNVMKL